MTGDIEIKRPLTLAAWDNHFLVKEASDPEKVDVRYQKSENHTPVQQTIESDLPTFTMFLAHLTTPEDPAPGLNLSYSRTIGAIHALWREEYLNADFKVEQDRLLASIQRLTSETTYTPRPDFGMEEVEEIDDRFLNKSDSVTSIEIESAP